MFGGDGVERRFLPRDEGIQQRGHFVRRHLRRKRVQRGGIRVAVGEPNPRQHRVQLGVLLGQLGRQLGVLLLQCVLQFLVALGAEELAENAAPLLGGGVQQTAELPLRDHGDLRELVVVQPDEVRHGGGDLFRFRHGRAAVGVGEDGVGLFGGEALAPRLGAEIFRVPPDRVPCPVDLKFQLHKGRGPGGGILAAQHAAVPHAAAGMVVQGVGDGVKKGSLARAGVAGDEVQPAPAQTLEVQHSGGSVGAKGGKGQFQGPHASSSFQSDSMSC